MASNANTDVDKLITFGQMALEQGWYDQARGYFQQALALDLSNREATDGLARIDAILHCKEAAAIEPTQDEPVEPPHKVVLQWAITAKEETKEQGRSPIQQFKLRQLDLWKIAVAGVPLLFLFLYAGLAGRISPTPEATPTPVLSAPGIGVSRADIQSVFESEKFGFRFEDVHDRGGQPTVWGYPWDWTNCDLFLIGPPEELVEVVITIGLDDDHPSDEASSNRKRMGTLLKLVAPDWENGDDWLTDNMLIAKMGMGERVETFHGDLRIQLKCVYMGMVKLSIERRGN